MPLVIKPDEIESEIIEPMVKLKKDVKDKLKHMRTHVDELPEYISGDSADAICGVLDETFDNLGKSFDKAISKYISQLRGIVAEMRDVDEQINSSIK